MEESLLPSGSSRRRDSKEETKSSVLGRRVVAITAGDKYQKAAAMVDQAEDGLGLPLEVLEQSNFEQAAKWYFWFIGLDLLWSLDMAVLLLLNFFEVPLWCKEEFPDPCGNREKFYLGGLPYLTRTQSLILELVSWMVLAVYTLYPITFTGNKLFWKSRLDNVKVILLVVLAADTIFNAFYVAPWGPIDNIPFRLAPYIRVIIVAISIRGLRDCMRTLMGIIPDFLNIAVLLLLFLLFSSWLAYVLFEDTAQGKTVFTSYGATLYQMSILFTTANNPDVWMPAYQVSRYTCVFFILYILFGVYFITNLVLAVVYDSFKGQLAKNMVEMDKKRQSGLNVAFGILDEQSKGYLEIAQCAQLFKELNTYRTLPKIADEDMQDIFYALDDSGDFKINKEEFADLCSAISLKFEKAEEPAYIEHFPRIYNSKNFKELKQFVRSKHFEYIIMGMLLANLVTVIIETTLDIQNSSSQYIWQDVELALGWLYVVEMVLKVVAYGFHNYWRSDQNRFDFVITVTVVVVETLTFILPSSQSNNEEIRYLLIARLLRLTRLLVLVEQYKVLVSTFFKLIPSVMPYLGVTFCSMCLFCILGNQVFGGLVYAGNPKLPGSEIAINDYMVNNFNDFPSGMVTLFNILVLGNWQVWMDGYAQLTGKWWTVFYFWGFYVLGVLFLFNLVAAFVLEAFFAEIELYSSQDSPGNEDLDGQVAINGNVQTLMNHILSSELEKTRSMQNP
ncbi:unnamed protein product [Sphagnum compactum]